MICQEPLYIMIGGGHYLAPWKQGKYLGICSGIIGKLEFKYGEPAANRYSGYYCKRCHTTYAQL